MNKVCLQDERLSWKAKGIYAYLMSLPDNWSIKTSEVVKHSPDGKTSLLSGLKELIKFGYCEHTTKRENGRIINRDYLVKEPHQLDSGNLNQDFLDQENQPLLSNDINKNNFTKELNNTTVLFPAEEFPKEKKALPKKKKKAPKKFHPDSAGGKLAKYMLDEIEKHDPTCENPDLGSWEGVFNKMIFIRGIPYTEIKDVIWYSQYSDFWKSFIINPFALNAKYKTLKIQLIQLRKKQNSEQEKESVFDRAKKEFFKNNN